MFGFLIEGVHLCQPVYAYVLSARAQISQAVYVTDFLFHSKQCVGGGGLWVTRGEDKIILHPVNI